MTTTTKGTQRQQLSALVTAYILNAIDGEGYDKELTTDRDKLIFLAECFIDEYCFPDNLKRYGSYQNTFAEWIQGLPSSFNLDYKNYRIIEIAKEWNSIPQNADDRAEDKILANWWNFISAKVMVLFNKHKIQLYTKD